MAVQMRRVTGSRQSLAGRFAPGRVSRALAVAVVALSATVAATQAEVTAVGPDVTVFSLSGISQYGGSGGFHGYSVGTVSCNRGDTPLNWCDQSSGCAPGVTSHDHPVIAQNMYRLKDGRFEQIGMSWLKHGFVSTNSLTAGCTGSAGGSCSPPPYGGNQLGVGCTDPYGSGLNGSRPLGMRSEVDSTTGAYPFPFTAVGTTTVYDQRMKVADVDLDVAFNADALYWVEGQYVAPDDALSGNGRNNASYRTATVGPAPTLNVAVTGSTVEAKSAIHAWKAQDATVEIFNEDFCASPVERFEVARKATPGVSSTHYEYAVRNMNSDHSAGAFTVRFPPGTVITNAYFHDIDSHSGEPYATTDWTVAIDTAGSSIRWETESYGANEDANALRWATMYTFAFDAEAPVEDADHEVELFKPVAVVDAGSDAAICPGDSVQLGTPAVAGQTYLWSPGGQTTAQIDVSPADTTTYTLTVTAECGQVEDTVEVTVGTVPDAPVLTSPEDGATELISPVALDWDEVAGAGTYTFQVASDSGFNDIVAANETGTTGYDLGILAAGQYFWHVRAYDGCAGDYSATFDFTVGNQVFIDGFESGDFSAGWVSNLP